MWPPAHGLGKLRGAVHRYAVQRLAPPVVGRHAEPRNGPCLIYQLGGLLLEVILRTRSAARCSAGRLGFRYAGFLASCAPASMRLRNTAIPPQPSAIQSFSSFPSQAVRLALRLVPPQNSSPPVAPNSNAPRKSTVKLRVMEKIALSMAFSRSCFAELKPDCRPVIAHANASLRVTFLRPLS